MGELDIHARAFLPFLSRHGYYVKVVNTSHWSFHQKIPGTEMPVYNLYENRKIRFLFSIGFFDLEWFSKATFYSLVEKKRLTYSRVKQIIKQEGIEVIYGSWGAHALPELRLVQKFNVPIIYEFLTYPVQYILSFAVKLENCFNRKMVNSLKGRIFATQRMLNYMKNVFGIHHGKNTVFMECYSKKFFYRTRLPRLSERDGRPHLIFIGLNVYDIFPQIEEIIRRGIHVHVCDTKGLKQRLRSLKFKDFVHTFKKFDYSKILNGTLATFMTQFDACLVTYNFRKASILDRFYNSIPNRFSLALTAGIPIVMPKGYLKGCEEIIGKHQIGFTYSNYADLKNKLGNRELIDYYRRNVTGNSKDFTLEKNFEKIDNFLKQLYE